MKNHMLVGLGALGALAYCTMFFVLPQTAIDLGNAPWGFFLNLFGFFCFLGGWATFLQLLKSEPRRFFGFALNALFFEIVALAVSPAAWAFVQTDTNRYLAFCGGFFGPVAGSLYVLWMVLKLQRKTASA